MNYFIFSSPLQCFFASLVSKMSQEHSIGLYYDYGPRSFKDIYWPIVKNTEGSFLSIQSIDSLDINSITEGSNLFLANRFSTVEIDFYYKNKKKFKHFNLFEEGTSTYLPHHLHSKGSNDKSLKLRLKNIIFKLQGKLPSHIYFNQFDVIYTSLPFRNPCKKNVRVVLKLNEENSVSTLRDHCECMFISQSVVADSILLLDDYNHFVVFVIERLLSKYDKVYYKNHPRDSEDTLQILKEKFGKKIVELPYEYKNLPVEIFLFKNRNIDLFGIATSTLFYYSYLMKGNSIQVLSLLLKKYPENVKIQDMMDSTDKMLKEYNVIEMK